MASMGVAKEEGGIKCGEEEQRIFAQCQETMGTCLVYQVGFWSQQELAAGTLHELEVEGIQRVKVVGIPRGILNAIKPNQLLMKNAGYIWDRVAIKPMADRRRR